MRVLAVDPGIVNCGVAVVDVLARPSVVFLHTEKQKSAVPATERKAQIGRFVRDLLSTGGVQVDLIVVEDQMGVFFGHQARGTTNASSLHLQGIVDMTRGIALCNNDCPFVTLTPQQVRFRLGLKRDATKEVVAKAIRLRLGRLPESATEHSIDAIAIALAGAAEFRFKTSLKSGKQALGPA